MARLTLYSMFVQLAITVIVPVVFLYSFGLFDLREAVTLTVVLGSLEVMLAYFLHPNAKEFRELSEATKHLNDTTREILDYLKKRDQSEV